MHETKRRFATRLNSFGSRPDAYWPKGHGKPSPLELAERASRAEGLTDVDLNYPDRVGSDPRVTGEEIRDLGLAVNGLAMRYYSNPAFKIGAFTNPDPAVRRDARRDGRGHREGLTPCDRRVGRPPVHDQHVQSDPF